MSHQIHQSLLDLPYSLTFRPRKWLNISALVTVSRCPRRFFYNYGLGLTSGEHPALKFGEAIHAALGECLTKYDLKLAMEKFSLVWEDRDGLGDPKRNSTIAALMLANFIFTHQKGLSLYELVPPPKAALAVTDRQNDFEVPFAIDIGLPVPLVGRIDGIGRDRHTRELAILEFKTTSEMSDRIFSAFDLSPQVVGYSTYLQAAQEEPINKAFVDFGLVAKTRQGWQIKPVYIRDHMRETFLKWARFWGSFILHCETTGEFPQWYTGCHPYSTFGVPGYPCEYYRLCQVEDWRTLADTYGVKEYDPYSLPDGVDYSNLQPVKTPLTVEGKPI